MIIRALISLLKKLTLKYGRVKIRVIITDAKFESGELKILRVIPEGKKKFLMMNFKKVLDKNLRLI